MKKIEAHPSEIVWLPRMNSGRHVNMVDTVKEKNALSVELCKRGWDSSQVLEVTPLTEEEKKEAIDFLEKEAKSYATLAAAKDFDAISEFKLNTESNGEVKTETIKLSANDLEKGFALTHMDKGKIVAPKYAAVYAFQRGEALIGANALRSVKGQKPIEVIEAHVMNYTPAQRIEACARENIKKHMGEKPVTSHWPTLLQIVYLYFLANNKKISESKVTDLISSNGEVQDVGRGQKLFAILTLDSRFPELGLVKKILDSGIDPTTGKDLGQIYAASLDRDTLRALEIGTRDVDPPKDKTKIKTKKDVLEYFANPAEANEAKVKPFAFKTIKQRGDLVQNLKVKYIFRQIQDSTNEDLFTKFDSCAKEDNAWMEAVGLAKDGKLV